MLNLGVLAMVSSSKVLAINSWVSWNYCILETLVCYADPATFSLFAVVDTGILPFWSSFPPAFSLAAMFSTQNVWSFISLCPWSKMRRMKCMVTFLTLPAGRKYNIGKHNEKKQRKGLHWWPRIYGREITRVHMIYHLSGLKYWCGCCLYNQNKMVEESFREEPNSTALRFVV